MSHITRIVMLLLTLFSASALWGADRPPVVIFVASG